MVDISLDQIEIDVHPFTSYPTNHKFLHIWNSQ
jgi:hypothetical protein